MTYLILSLKRLTPLLAGLIILGLNACSSTPTTPSAPVTQDVTHLRKIPQDANQPPSTIQKAGKTLQLGRILDGGACKNAQQGVKASFLLYASTDDIKKIQRKQGAKIFTKLEKSITDFSMAALQKVANKLNYNNELPQQFVTLFEVESGPSIKHFQTTNGLNIAVKPMLSELVFYTNGCEATREAVEE